MEISSHLTRKQQKAQAFKSKQKAKKRGDDTEQQDVPEQDPVEDIGDDDAVVSETRQSKTSGSRKAGKSSVEGGLDVGSSAKRKVGLGTVLGKGKKRKTAWDEEDGDEAENEGSAAVTTKEKSEKKKEVKQRFILFIGNLDYKTTQKHVQDHFAEALGSPPTVRLLTTKPSPAGSKSKSKAPALPQSRGIAFLELDSSTALQTCLKLHQSLLGGRRINVELTAGGGGKGQGRMGKIKDKQERVGGQRERKIERENEMNGEQGGDASGQFDELHGRAAVGTKRKRANKGESAEALADGSKVRGGRRVRTKSSNQDEAPQGTFESGGKRTTPTAREQRRIAWRNNAPHLREDQVAQTQQRRDGGGPKNGRNGSAKRRFQPTGANAVVVG